MKEIKNVNILISESIGANSYFGYCRRELSDVFFQTLDEWVYIDLYMGLYTWAQ